MGGSGEKIVDIPQVRQVDVPHITTVEKHVEVPHHQTVEKVVEVPMIGDEIQGMVNHTHNHLPVQRQQHPPEYVHHHEVGMPFDTHYAGVVGQAVVGGAMPMAIQVGGSASIVQPLLGSTTIVQPGGSTMMPQPM